MGHRAFGFDYCGYYKLVGDVCPVGLGEHLQSITRKLPLAVHDGVVRRLNAFPPLVPVHSIVATGYGADFPNRCLLHLVEHSLHKALTAPRRGVATIGESLVDHTLYTMTLRQFQQREQVRPMAVHSSRPEQSEEVQRRVVRFHMLASAYQFGVGEEGAVFDGVVQAG